VAVERLGKPCERPRGLLSEWQVSGTHFIDLDSSAAPAIQAGWMVQMFRRTFSRRNN
jgi:hypothetical protein